MNFTTDFLEKTTALFQQAFTLKKYKAMHIVLAILVGIVMLPFAAICFIAAGILYGFGYLFKIVTLPVEELHKLLHNEGQAVKHGTQFILYFISWGFIFTSYAMLSLLTVFATILYSVCSITAYVWTLGGIKFHVFPAQADDISVEVTGKYKPILPIILVAGTAVLMLLIPLIRALGICIDIGFDFITWDVFTNILKFKIAGMSSWSFWFSFLYTVIFLAPKKATK